MTTLGTGPLDPDQADFLNLLADYSTPLGKLAMEDFRDACWADAIAHDGYVHPSRVAAILHARFGEIDPRSFSARWAPACGKNGFLDKTDELAPIDGEHSRGNQNKSVRIRRWRDWPAAA